MVVSLGALAMVMVTSAGAASGMRYTSSGELEALLHEPLTSSVARRRSAWKLSIVPTMVLVSGLAQLSGLARQLPALQLVPALQSSELLHGPQVDEAEHTGLGLLQLALLRHCTQVPVLVRH